MGHSVVSGAAPEPLDRAAIDQVIDALTMGDVQAGFEDGVSDKALGGVAFRRAARRLGLVKNGVDPLDLVPATLVRYVGERMQEAMSESNPKSPGTAG